MRRQESQVERPPGHGQEFVRGEDGEAFMMHYH